MKYAVIEVSNGNFKIASEDDDRAKAIIKFHEKCAALWNEADVKTGCVQLADEQMENIRIEHICKLSIEY